MKKLSKLSAVVLAAGIAVTSANVALAYPAGTNPSLGLSSYSRLTPGDSVSAVVSRVARGCQISVAWKTLGGVTVGSASTATAGRTGRTPAVSVASPSTGGRYNLVATLGTGCYGDAGTITKAITVGKAVRHSISVKTTSASARRNPTLTFTGKLFWGAVPVANKTVEVVITKPGGATSTVSATTNASGVYTATVTASDAGAYRATATLDADDTYAGSVLQSRSVTIRP